MTHAGRQYRTDALITTLVLSLPAGAFVWLYLSTGHWATLIMSILSCAIVTACLAEIAIMAFMNGHPDAYRSLFNRYLPLFNLLLPFKTGILRLGGITNRTILEHFFILNNELVERALRDTKPRQVLLLLPHCMQFSGCKVDVIGDIDNCKSCGKCQIGDLLAYKEKYGIPIRVCLRTRYALTHISELKPELVIGVACESRLFKGVRGAKGLYRYLINTEKGNDCCVDNSIMIEKASTILQRLYGY